MLFFIDFEILCLIDNVVIIKLNQVCFSFLIVREDLSGVLGKQIMEVVKERDEVWFGLWLFFIDCREEIKKGMVGYECDEVKLWFDYFGFDQIKVIVFGDYFICIIKE